MIHATDLLQRLRHSPRAATYVLRVGGAATAVLAGRLAALAVGGPALPPVDLASVAPATTGPAPAAVADVHLFGLPSGPGPAVKTTLVLTLRGTAANASDPSRSVAILAGAGGRDATYRIGDPLPGGGVLAGISRDKVDISNGGRREILPIVRHDRTGTKTAKPASTARTAPLGGVDPSAAVRKLDGTQLADRASMLPVLEDGRVVGARIATANVALLERIGLRRDDVIVSIDGQAVTGTAIAATLPDRLRGGEQIALLVLREGREVEVRVGAPPP